MIHTKVAKIINPSVVVLAAGSEQGVQEGMEFLIYVLSDEVRDPETGESLGRIELHKGRVKAYHVQPRMCLASTLPRYDRIPLFAGPKFASSFVDEMLATAPLEELQVDREQLGEPIDMIVRVGDTVRSLHDAPVPPEALAK